ncbi:MAG: hypothetical protein ACRD1T_25855 [Acidimicrobiia bacterium]
MTEKARLTLDLPPEVHARLKIAAVKKRTSMREYCTNAIVHRLSEESIDYLTAESDPVLAELWDNDDDAVYDDL